MVVDQMEYNLDLKNYPFELIFY